MLKNIKEKRSKDLLEFINSDGEWVYKQNRDGTVDEYQVIGNIMKHSNTFKNYHAALLSWRNTEKEQLVDYENIYLTKEDYFLLDLEKEYEHIYNKLNNIENSKGIIIEECTYDIYEDNILIERSIPFERLKERCEILMRMYNEEKNKFNSTKKNECSVEVIYMNDKKFSLSFECSDAGCEYIKWHNFYAESLDHVEKQNYIIQITQEEGYEPQFMIECFTKGNEEDDLEEWIDLEEFLKNSKEVQLIKNTLIRMSDELIEKEKILENNILLMSEDQTSINKMKEYYEMWNENVEIIDINMRIEMFDALKKDLIKDIGEIIKIQIDSNSTIKKDNYNFVKNILNWCETIDEIMNLKCNNDGYSYLLNYFEERGFGLEWEEKLNNIFDDSRIDVYEDSIDELMM